MEVKRSNAGGLKAEMSSSCTIVKIICTALLGEHIFWLCISNLMQCTAYGQSIDRLTPHPFNLCKVQGSRVQGSFIRHILNYTEYNQ